MSHENDRRAFDEARSKAEALMDLPYVVGVGEGVTSDGTRSITVMVTAGELVEEDRIPPVLVGYPVEIIEVGVLQSEEDQ